MVLLTAVRLSNRVAGLKDVLIVSASRTPVGSFKKSLASCTAPYLGAQSIRATINRIELDVQAVQAIYMGQVCQAGAGQDPARQAALGAGLPTSVPTFTVNKVCASGLKAIQLAAQSLQTGARQVMLAGGQESMSNVPYYMWRREPAYGGVQLVDGIVHDGLWDVYNQIHMGDCVERTVARLGISRAAQDAYALESYRRSQAAAQSGVFSHEIAPVALPTTSRSTGSGQFVEVDEEYSRPVDADKLARLKPAFSSKSPGTITAANASSLNDGAAACLLMTAEAALNQFRVSRPLARVVHSTDAACDPVDFALAPVLAVRQLLRETDRCVQDIGLWEVNEAFAAVVLACVAQLELDVDRVNVHGGAVSIGHPIGMSGARIVNHLALNLKPGQLGVAAICNGGGGASAMLLEGLN